MFNKLIRAAIDNAMAEYISKVEKLIARSENRVDTLNAMMQNVLTSEREHAHAMEHASGMFKTSVETYAHEVAEMRKNRDAMQCTIAALERDLHDAQCEIKRLMEINAELQHTHQLLVANATKTNINVTKQ